MGDQRDFKTEVLIEDKLKEERRENKGLFAEKRAQHLLYGALTAGSLYLLTNFLSKLFK